MQGAKQPPGLVRQRLAAAGRERGRDELAVPIVTGSCGFGGPDCVEDAEVVGVSQVAPPDSGSRQLGTAAVEPVSEHRDGLALS